MDNNDRVLLVEGPNDKHVVRHLCNFHKEVPKFWILDKEGIEVLLEDIGSEILAPGRKAVGIIVDANDDLDARWRCCGRTGFEKRILRCLNTPKLTGTHYRQAPAASLESASG